MMHSPGGGIMINTVTNCRSVRKNTDLSPGSLECERLRKTNMGGSGASWLKRGVQSRLKKVCPQEFTIWLLAFLRIPGKGCLSKGFGWDKDKGLVAVGQVCRGFWTGNDFKPEENVFLEDAWTLILVRVIQNDLLCVLWVGLGSISIV